MTTSSIEQFKAIQKESWSLFAPIEILTTPPASLLVEFSQLNTGDKVLDVACGTGVVAVTASHRGAHVKGIDLSPVLVEKARWNANLAEQDIDFKQGDVENLPYQNDEFDVVLSQFGHMFAPQPHIAVAEMLRVLKPGGRIAFSTWPPDFFTAKMFDLTAKYLPLPEGIVSPSLWGDHATIKARLGKAVSTVEFKTDIMWSPTLSPKHSRYFLESTLGPLAKLVEKFKNGSTQLNKFRIEFESLISEYTKNNTICQHFIMTKGQKV